MSPSRIVRAIAASAAFALVVGACGGDSSSDSATGSTAAGAATTEAGGSATTEAGGTDGEIGSIVDGVAQGPSGFTIDTNDCPDGWSNTEGITDTEIKLGHSWIFSGTLAGYAAISDGMEAWFASESEKDPEAFGGRKITLEAKDDGYEAARTVTNVTELIEKDKIFAIPGLAGTANNLAVYDYINEECVPHAAATGHPAWGDPVHHPWTTPTFLGYSTEGQIWAELIKNAQDDGTLPNPAKVGVLTMNNDFGLALYDPFKIAVDASDGRIEIVDNQLHDQAAPNVTNEITTLAATKADVMIAATVGVFCAQTMTGIAESGWDATMKIIAAVCIGPGQFQPAAEAGDGWIIAAGQKDLRSPLYDDDPIIKEGRAIFDEAGIDWKQNANAGSALLYAPPVVEALKEAHKLPGGITRTNLVIAQRQLDFQHPYYLDGIKWHMDGLNDAYTIEGSQPVKHVFDAALGYAEPTELLGELIDVDGETPNCHYVNGKCEAE